LSTAILDRSAGHGKENRLLVPRHLAGAVSCHEEAFREHLTQPLPGEIVDELRWYFAACRDGGVDLDDRCYRAQ
jgi:hypothetical protein